MEGKDYFATVDDVMRFCQRVGPHAMPSTRVGANQHGGGGGGGKADKAEKAAAAAAAVAMGAGDANPAPAGPVPPSAASLAQTAALAQEGRARAEGLNRRQRLEAVFVAAFTGDAPLLAALVKVDPSLVRAEAEAGADGDDDGATPLLVAARRGHPECVRVLLDAGPGDTIKQVRMGGCGWWVLWVGGWMETRLAVSPDPCPCPPSLTS